MIRMRLLASILVLTTACSAQADEHGTARRWTPDAISTAGYEAAPSFSPDGREIFYIAADAGFSSYRIQHSRCTDGRWSKPVPAPFAVAGVDEADPFVTPDGKSIYYISALHASDRTDFDIWSVDRRPDGGWSTPRRLPEPVNSTHSELLPRVDAQGRLIFGSDRPGGLGKGDIYAASQDAAGNWTVANLGTAVNTAAHEYEAEVSRDGRTMVVVADREGRSHLYRYKLDGNRWALAGRIPAREDVFQVSPLLSPRGDRLLFSQADGARSGEMFLIDLTADPDKSWPPECGQTIAP